MDWMENLVLFLGSIEVCLFQGSELCSLYRRYSLASRVPSHKMVTELLCMIMEPGSAERVGLGRVPVREQERRRHVCHKPGIGNVVVRDNI
jgi:hypothetical protein